MKRPTSVRQMHKLRFHVSEVGLKSFLMLELDHRNGKGQTLILDVLLTLDQLIGIRDAINRSIEDELRNQLKEMGN